MGPLKGGFAIGFAIGSQNPLTSPIERIHIAGHHEHLSTQTNHNLNSMRMTK